MDPHASVISEHDPEDILSASLQTLYDFSPITFSSAGSTFTYTPKPPHQLKVIEITTPDTQPSNWSLHASSIWVSSLFIADHVEELRIQSFPSNRKIVRVVELGAGAGLPSIVIGSLYPNVSVTVSDYPDNDLIRTLTDNVRRNRVSEQCRAVPYAWGTDVSVLVNSGGEGDCRNGNGNDTLFDIVVAADTLWNPELHAPFLDTLCMCLKREPESHIHLVAGLHTGRYTIQAFLERTQQRGLVVESAMEREVGGTQSRPWDVSRAGGEDERERRKWVVWMILKWGGIGLVGEMILMCVARTTLN